MQAAGTLELVAEIAVAFAGFSGIIGVYRARTDRSHDPRSDLRLLVEYGLFLLAVALLPLFLWHGGLAEERAWRVASLGIALPTTRSARSKSWHQQPSSESASACASTWRLTGCSLYS